MIRDSTRILRALNFIYENKFSREAFLANCHWQFSPGPPFGLQGSRPQFPPNKKDSLRMSCLFGGDTGTRTLDPRLAKAVL
jgi:hypothetical protein